MGTLHGRLLVEVAEKPHEWRHSASLGGNRYGISWHRIVIEEWAFIFCDQTFLAGQRDGGALDRIGWKRSVGPGSGELQWLGAGPRDNFVPGWKTGRHGDRPRSSLQEPAKRGQRLQLRRFVSFDRPERSVAGRGSGLQPAVGADRNSTIV